MALLAAADKYLKLGAFAEANRLARNVNDQYSKGSILPEFKQEAEYLISKLLPPVPIEVTPVSSTVRPSTSILTLSFEEDSCNLSLLRET